jgi:hypothetical protein
MLGSTARGRSPTVRGPRAFVAEVDGRVVGRAQSRLENRFSNATDLAFSGVTSMVTTNDAPNAPMLAVNGRLGYSPSGRYGCLTPHMSREHALQFAKVSDTFS